MPTTAITDLTIDLAFDAVVAGFDATWDKSDCWVAFSAIMRTQPDMTVSMARLAMERIADRAIDADSTLSAVSGA